LTHFSAFDNFALAIHGEGSAGVNIRDSGHLEFRHTSVPEDRISDNFQRLVILADLLVGGTPSRSEAASLNPCDTAALEIS